MSHVIRENKKISNFTLKEVDEIDGAVLIINKDKFTSYEFMDEKFFLYFENTDLCLRLRRKNQKLYEGSRIMELVACGLKLDACCLGLEACSLELSKLGA